MIGGVCLVAGAIVYALPGREGAKPALTVRVGANTTMTSTITAITTPSTTATTATTGSAANGTTVAAVKSAFATEESLDQSTLVPPPAGPDNPAAPAFADQANQPVTPHVDASGLPDLTEAVQQTMVANAQTAFTKVLSPALASKELSTLKSAMASETTGGDTVMLDAGATVLHYESVTVTGNTASVHAIVKPFEQFIQINSNGTQTTANPVNELDVNATLYLGPQGNWLVGTRTWVFVPGYGP